MARPAAWSFRIILWTWQNFCHIFFSGEDSEDEIKPGGEADEEDDDGAPARRGVESYGAGAAPAAAEARRRASPAGQGHQPPSPPPPPRRQQRLLRLLPLQWWQQHHQWQPPELLLDVIIDQLAAMEEGSRMPICSGDQRVLVDCSGCLGRVKMEMWGDIGVMCIKILWFFKVIYTRLLNAKCHEWFVQLFRMSIIDTKNELNSWTQNLLANPEFSAKRFI